MGGGGGNPSRGKGRGRGPEAGACYEALWPQCGVKSGNEVRGLGKASTPSQEHGSYSRWDQKALESQRQGARCPDLSPERMGPALAGAETGGTEGTGRRGEAVAGAQEPDPGAAPGRSEGRP